MKLRTKLCIAALAALPSMGMAAEPAEATSFKDALLDGKFSGMLRLRYETVNQDNPLDNANGLTLRSSVGYTTKPLNGFSLTAVAYNVTQFVDEMNDTENKDTSYSVIADPQDTDFHNLFLQYATKNQQFRLGRQNIFLDNWRHVGDVRFRQNWAVFDGFSYVNTMIPKTKIFYGHFERIKQVTTQKVDIKADFINANYKVSKGTNLIGYGYFTEFENEPRANTSAKTIGVRLHGKEKINDTFSALFTAEYAKQTDYKDALDIDAKYYLISGGVGIAGWDIRLNKEFLEGTSNDSTRPFQPHFGTNHLFQGWADLFLATPDAGIDDTFISVVGKFMGAKIKAEYHMIDSDNAVGGDDEFGNEFDLGIYYKFKKNIIGSFEYANFNAESDSTLTRPDTEKFWITGIYKF